MVVDFLSRLSHNIDDEVVDDSFLDEYLFSITIQTPWYANLANYLVIEKLSQHFTPNNKTRLIEKSSSYFWFGGYLYHIGLNNIMRICIREDERGKKEI